MGKIGDLWVRLGLKKDGFDKGMDSVKKKGVDALKGVAGAAGVAMGAMEVFNRVVTANESNNDKWENTVRAMNNAVNEFFSALTSGDFSGFQDGLEGIARKARETAEALRQIEDAQTVYGLFGTENRAIFNENMVTLRNKNASKEEIDAAKKAVEDVMAVQEEQSNVLIQKSIAAVKNFLTQRGDLETYEFSENDIKDVLSLAIDRQGGIRSEELEQQYKEYVESVQPFIDRRKFLEGKRYREGWDPEDYDKYQETIDRIKELSSQNLLPRLNNALWNETKGDELNLLVNLLRSAQSTRLDLSSMQRSYQRVDQSTANAGGSGTEPPPPEGSLAYLQQKLKEAQDAAATAVGEEAQKQAAATVKAIEAEIQAMTLRIDTLNALEDGTYVDKFIGDVELPENFDFYGTDKKIDLKKSKMEVPELETVDFEDSINQASNAIGVLGGALSNITGLVDKGAASWISYGANVVQAIAQAIPLISSLTAAKELEAQAAGKAAAAEAGSAVAGTPVVGPLMAVAAIASVIAALANIPKFAEGGVVGGSSYYGDRILARLNSGELVLNRGQQAALLDNLERPGQNVHVSGEFRISGRDLRLVLDKYDNYRTQ